MSSPTRWLLMAGHVPPGGSLGGIVRYTVELAKALERRPDVELHVLTSPQAENSVADMIGCHGRTLAMPKVPGDLVSVVERYLLAGRLKGFDVVQGAKHLLPRGVAARTALTVHDMLLFERPQDFSRAKRTLLRQPYAASLRQADVLVCVSAATQERVRAFSSDLAARTAVVPLATSPALLTSTPEPVAAAVGRPFGLVVGDSQPRKNVATAVSAWKQVVRERPDALLVLVGPPAWGEESYGPDYLSLLASGHVQQLTGISDAVLRWCYENAAVVLAPSLAEGFGLPAVEALDLGAPLVTSLDPALVEASGSAATHLPADDVRAWTEAALKHLAAAGSSAIPSTSTDRSVRTWDDVAEETVRSVLRTH